MSDKIWEVRLTLSNGETRYLANAGGDVARATAMLTEFSEGRRPFDGEWVETVESTYVARSHLVEVQVVPT